MAVVLINESTLTDIADAIRSKNGQETLYKPSDMPDAIEAISGGITPTGTIEITQNGVVDVTNYASADVDVPQGITPTGTKQISITENGTTTEDVTNYADAEITVNVSGGGSQQLTKLTEITLSENSRSMAITLLSSWFDYDYLVIKYNLTLSASDWIYFSKTNLSGGGYTASAVTEYKIVGNAYKSGTTFQFMFPQTTTRTGVSANESLYLYAYSSSKQIVSGSSISIYGGLKSDLQ